MNVPFDENGKIDPAAFPGCSRALEFVSIVNDADGNPIYENTMQWAILKKEWDASR